MEIKINSTYKGTRILYGELSTYKRKLINKMIDILSEEGFTEIMIPIIQKEEVFEGKVGVENGNMMYTFKDMGNRDLCLSPEYTAVIQKLASEKFIYGRNQPKEEKVFYVSECFRGERPQNGRYRQFTQFGVEIINPTEDYSEYMIELSSKLMSIVTDDFEVNSDATRGLDYYKEGKGFEISCEKLGAQKQICGGGEYDGGIGFALGIDRLIIIEDKKEI
ncbi:MAG: Histidine--tRNA ligase [uncultured marine phage]|uniref:Histidine--tRNA ligase n=1 Tax=uncultured marine phage TaxID=707152 RepID=A0A8D9FRJ8_9VIRU|nr:MAG: Histidine--tRNA ligase [uncultured marine phage]